MQQNMSDIQSMFYLFLKYFNKSINSTLIIFTIYLIYCAVFICNYSLRGIIFSFIAVVLAYTCYLLIYDITYIQYLISLRLDESLRLILVQYFPLFSFNKYAPSKAIPKINNDQFNLLKVRWKSSIFIKESIKYALQLQKRLLELSKIYILILSLPKTKYHIMSNNTMVKNCIKLIELIKYNNFNYIRKV